MTPRDRLTALFSPTRKLIGPEPAVLHAGGALGPLQWVVPRAACHYRRLEFGQLPARQRAAAATLAVRRHEPAPGALQHVAWTGATAHAWIWPQPDPVMAEGEPTWIPESLLRAPPAGDGPRLLQAIEGVEGQVWRDGQLQASQWWPAVPDADAWRRFLRACGIGPDAAGPVPAPEALPWATSPWGDAPRGLPGSPAALERLAWVAGLGLVALGLGWQLAAQATWGISQWRLDARLEGLRAQATPLLEARERADAAVERLQSYRALRQGANDYLLMADVIAPLPADARLLQWRREGERLQAGVASAETDPRRFVSAFQGHPVLADVAANPASDAKGMQLDFDLSAPPADAAANADGGTP